VSGRRLLGIYLNDHLAGSTAGMELARRAARSNDGTEYGELFLTLAKELEEDRNSLKGIMRRLEHGEDIPKKLGGWMAEKVGRLKPNGQITGYSPLSRVVELEALTLGVTGKLSLWRYLRDLVDVEPRLHAAELDRLRARAERQLGLLEEHRSQAAREAFRS
jgi:hypothetical protein